MAFSWLHGMNQRVFHFSGSSCPSRARKRVFRKNTLKVDWEQKISDAYVRIVKVHLNYVRKYRFDSDLEEELLILDDDRM